MFPRARVALVTRDVNLRHKAEYARLPTLEPPESEIGKDVRRSTQTVEEEITVTTAIYARKSTTQDVSDEQHSAGTFPNVRHIIVTGVVLAVLACSSRPAGLNNARVLNVCDAASQPIGSRVAVRGEFAGTDYSSQPTMFVLSSEGTCNTSGAGSIFANVWYRAEMARIADAVPRGKRQPTPGTGPHYRRRD